MFKGIFHCINHPFWGYPIYGTPHVSTIIILCFSETMAFCFLCDPKLASENGRGQRWQQTQLPSEIPVAAPLGCSLRCLRFSTRRCIWRYPNLDTKTWPARQKKMFGSKTSTAWVQGFKALQNFSARHWESSSQNHHEPEIFADSLCGEILIPPFRSRNNDLLPDYSWSAQQTLDYFPSNGFTENHSVEFRRFTAIRDALGTDSWICSRWWSSQIFQVDSQERWSTATHPPSPISPKKRWVQRSDTRRLWPVW